MATLHVFTRSNLSQNWIYSSWHSDTMKMWYLYFLQVIRELDRERSQLERQEKKLVVDIKKMAKSGQIEAVKIMAKDLVRTRNFVKKFILMRANIQAISLKVQTLKSQAAMANAMKGGRGFSDTGGMALPLCL